MSAFYLVTREPHDVVVCDACLTSTDAATPLDADALADLECETDGCAVCGEEFAETRCRSCGYVRCASWCSGS